MQHNLVGTINMIKEYGIVPNFSKLQKEFGVDRHTIKKIYEGRIDTLERKKKISELDEFKDEILEMLKKPYISLKAMWFYLRNEKNVKTTYNNFKSYVRNHDLRNQVLYDYTPHPLFETDPGQQLQIDWVEDIKLMTKHGELIEFNLFSATLGYSRLHYFIYTETKTEDDFIRCLINYYKFIGGTTKELLTDNMSAIVNINNNKRTIHPRITQFFKDIGVELKLCQVRSPQTKGKNETSNKYPQWLLAYDHKLEDKNDLFRVIKNMNKEINLQVNTRTLVPPAIAFEKEKEYLDPLPSREILESYQETIYTYKVPSTLLITHKGAKYSVPSNFINKTVKVKEYNNKVFIIHQDKIINEHDIKPKGTINYKKDDYKSGLEKRLKNSDIDQYMINNLDKFKNFGDKK